MVRFLGTLILWLGIALSVCFRVPLPKDQRIPKEIQDFAVPVKKDADKDDMVALSETSRKKLAQIAKAKQNEIDVPPGTRALTIFVVKNNDLETGRILLGAKVDLLIQDTNETESEKRRILVANTVYLANPTCRGLGVESEERRGIEASSCITVAVPLEDFARVVLAQAQHKLRLVPHTLEKKEER